MKELRQRAMGMAEQEPLDNITRQFSEIPSTTFLTAAMMSILGSMFLLLIGRRWESIFVGLWAPTIITFGLVARLFGISYKGRF